jgi:uncharacterized protein YjiS (DUF1127 family)
MLQAVLTQALERAERSAPSLGFRLMVWSTALWVAYQRRRRYRMTVGTLGALDDRTLHDIGIHRSEIESFASHQGADRFPNRIKGSQHFPRG